jgi:hypothetical protein
VERFNGADDLSFLIPKGRGAEAERETCDFIRQARISSFMNLFFAA